jgi:uncharacterized protein YjbI with pentapeptide repeats
VSSPARRIRSRLRSPRVAWTIVALAVIACTFALDAFGSSSATVLGACAIRGGTVCEGNYMAGAQLHDVDLFGADLRRVDLSRAQLPAADLDGAVLDWALLKRANLTGADLEYANLMHADLRHAVLDRTNLTYANLTGARVDPDGLRFARLCATVMPDGIVANPHCDDFEAARRPSGDTG